MSKQLICKICGESFSYKVKLANGKWHKVGPNRSSCFKCHPIRHRLDVYVNGKKQCNSCKQFLPISDFYVNSVTHKPKSFCVVCYNKRLSKQKVSNQVANKLKAIEYKGGKCCRCGYNTYYGALEFHHKLHKSKTGDISLHRHQNSLFEDWKHELDKCILVCANCHREIHHEEYKNSIMPT